METIDITGLAVIILTAFMVGYVLGVEHGADQARQDQDDKQ